MPTRDVNEDELGLHRQPTESQHGTVLRGGSFMLSIQDAKRRHEARLRAVAAQAATAAAADTARPRSPPTDENDHQLERARPSTATSTPQLSRVNSPREERQTATAMGSGGKPSRHSSGGRNSAGGLDGIVAADLSREPTMLHSSTQLLPSPLPEKKYTIVLDLDETVIYGREGSLSARAHLKQLLRTLDECAEVVVWTAGERSYAKAIVKEINSEGVIRHLVYRDDVWFDEEDYTKDLRKLGRDMNYVLIVENTPDCVRMNPGHGIIVSDFEGATSRQDFTLLKLAEVVKAMVQSGQPVPRYLASCKMLRRQNVITDEGQGTQIQIYYLSGRAKKSNAANNNINPGTSPTSTHDSTDAATTAENEQEEEGKTVKVNRDKRPRASAGAPAEVRKVEGTTPSRRPIAKPGGGGGTSAARPVGAVGTPGKARRAVDSSSAAAGTPSKAFRAEATPTRVGPGIGASRTPGSAGKPRDRSATKPPVGSDRSRAAAAAAKSLRFPTA